MLYLPEMMAGVFYWIAVSLLLCIGYLLIKRKEDKIIIETLLSKIESNSWNDLRSLARKAFEEIDRLGEEFDPAFSANDEKLSQLAVEHAAWMKKIYEERMDDTDLVSGAMTSNEMIETLKDYIYIYDRKFMRIFNQIGTISVRLGFQYIPYDIDSSFGAILRESRSKKAIPLYKLASSTNGIIEYLDRTIEYLFRIEQGQIIPTKEQQDRLIALIREKI